MFEVGFTEIILILGIALVVLGPEKLPKVAADIGRWVGRARAMARQLKTQLDEEVVKADRDWSRPEPTYKPTHKSGLQDLDASPNRAAPATPPPGESPSSAGVASEAPEPPVTASGETGAAAADQHAAQDAPLPAADPDVKPGP